MTWTMHWVRVVALGLGLASPAAAAEEASSAIDAEAIVADLREANARFDQGRIAESLALLEALVVRLGEDGRRRQPMVQVMIGRCHEKLGRPGEALRAYERAIAWADRASEVQERTRLRAVEFRDALRAEALGDLRVRCGPGVVAVRLPGRGEHRDCPASWSDLAAGAITIEPLEADGAVGHAVEARLLPGETTTVTVESNPDARWRFGGRIGFGLGSIVGETVYVEDTTLGPSVRVTGAVESPRLDGWLSGTFEVSAARGVLRYTDTGAIGPGGDAAPGVTPVDVDLVRYQIEAAVLARLCLPQRWSPCLALGGGVAALPYAEDLVDGRSFSSEVGRDQAHAIVRGAVEVRRAWAGWLPSVGLHVRYSPWPGAIQYVDDQMPWFDVSVDVGVAFCGMEATCFDR